MSAHDYEFRRADELLDQLLDELFVEPGAAQRRKAQLEAQDVLGQSEVLAAIETLAGRSCAGRPAAWAATSSTASGTAEDRARRLTAALLARADNAGEAEQSSGSVPKSIQQEGCEAYAEPLPTPDEPGVVPGRDAAPWTYLAFWMSLMASRLRPEEEASFSEYCAPRIRTLRRTAYVLSGDWHDAENLVQETLIKVYMRWPRIRSKNDIDAYIKRMLVNAFLDDRRRSRHAREVIADVLPEAPVEESNPVEDRLDVRQALATLGRSQRAVLLLRFYCDLSIGETARVLGCSVGNVKSQTARGEAALERALTAGRA